MYRITPYNRAVRSRDFFNLFDDFFNDTKPYNGSLRVDVRDLEKEYIVDADVPGLAKEDIEIHFENERLLINITKEEEKEESNNDYIHRERYSTSLSRSIYLKDVDPTKFKAKLENGVLTITAQKQEDKVNKYMIDIE